MINRSLPEPVDPREVRGILERSGRTGYVVLGKAEVNTRPLTVCWQRPQEMPADLAQKIRPLYLAAYASALEAEGFTCRVDGGCLVVRKYAT